MADFTYKVAGVVAFSDNSHEPFEFSVQNGQIHSPYGTESFAAFAQLYASTAGNSSVAIDTLLGLFVGPTHALTPVAPVADDKTVSDFNMEISGMIANDDNTLQHFANQYSFATGALIADEADGSAVLAYDKIIANATFLALVDTGWEVLTGAGRTSITT